MKGELDRLKTRLEFIYGDNLTNLEYQVTSISEKIKNFFETNLRRQKKNVFAEADEIDKKVSEIQKSLLNYHRQLDGKFLLPYYYYHLIRRADITVMYKS